MILKDADLYEEVSIPDPTGVIRKGFVIGKSCKYNLCLVGLDETNTPNDYAIRIHGNEVWSSDYTWTEISFINSLNHYYCLPYNDECIILSRKEIISPDLKCNICKLPAPHAKINAKIAGEDLYFCLPCNVLFNILKDEAELAR